MSLPSLLKESERTDEDWRRRVRDAVNLLLRRVADQGATTERPRAPNIGTQFYDTTLKRPIWWNGTAWTNAAGTVV